MRSDHSSTLGARVHQPELPLGFGPGSAPERTVTRRERIGHTLLLLAPFAVAVAAVQVAVVSAVDRWLNDP